MNDLPLPDILIGARRESNRLHHHYIGVEHLFIALLEIPHSLTYTILTDQGIQSGQVIELICRKAGKRQPKRCWPGYPDTPRTRKVISMAKEIAAINNRNEVYERDLFAAILQEGESIPTRILKALNLDFEEALHQVNTVTTQPLRRHPIVNIDLSGSPHISLNEDELFILRRMFRNNERISVDAELNGGYSDARLLVVTPYQIDNRREATVVVKIGTADAINDEKQRYDRYVRRQLPPLTARVEDVCNIEMSNLAGIKYTFMTGDDQQPHDVRDMLGKWQGSELGTWIEHRIYGYFGASWWQQRREYIFRVWQEYDWLLPPVLTLEYAANPPADATNIPVLHSPVPQSVIDRLTYGDLVFLDKFIVQKVDQDRNLIRLAHADGPYNIRANQIEIRNLDLERERYFRGGKLERIAGRVWRTRSEILLEAIRALQPDFDVEEDEIEVGPLKLYNPFRHYPALLQAEINGTQSIIHGDLHLGNILVGPSRHALLIDFEHAREGHTLFDWATLEISLLSEYIMPMVTPDWNGARSVICYLAASDRKLGEIKIPPEITEALEARRSIRRIVSECLASHQRWDEYHAALSLVSLRAILWRSMPLPNRQLMYLHAALYMTEFLKSRAQSSDHQTDRTPDQDHPTDLYGGS